MSLIKLEKIGKTVNIKNLIYRKNEYMYNFKNSGTINTFGRYIYNGVVTLKEADKDQSSLLVETLNFKSKTKPENPAKKLNIYIYIYSQDLHVLFDGRERALALAQVKAGNTSGNFQIIFFFYRAKEVTKNVCNNIMNSIKL